MTPQSDAIGSTAFGRALPDPSVRPATEPPSFPLLPALPASATGLPTHVCHGLP